MTTDARLTVARVAERLGVRVHAVLGWIATGELAAINVATSAAAKRPTWRIAVEALEQFEADRRHRSGKRRASSTKRREPPKDVMRFY